MQPSKSRLVSALFGILSLALVGSAQAAPITEDLDVFVEDYYGYADDVIGSTGTLTVRYDDADVDPDDLTVLDSSQFSLNLTLFGQLFTGVNDVGFDFGFPELVFDFGEIIFVDFIVNSLDLFNPTSILDPRIEEFGGGDVFDGTWYVTAYGAEVPVPATLVLIFAGVLGGAVARRRAS